MKDITLKFSVEPDGSSANEVECDNCFIHFEENGGAFNTMNEKTKDLSNSPIFIISSSKYQTLAEAKDQINNWFNDGLLDLNCAVYRIDKDLNGRQIHNPFYIISSTEFDTYDEAKDQIYEWHLNGDLCSKATIFRSDLNNCFEIEVGLVKATQY